MTTNREYLGDSVYAELEGGMIKLTTNNGIGPSNTIWLEQFVYDALVSYVERAIQKAREKR